MKSFQSLDLSLFHGDCVEQSLLYLRDNSVDLIITDPPYGIDGRSLDKHYNRDETLVLDEYIDIPKDEYAEFSHRWITEATRVLKPGGSMYIISGYTHLYEILHALRQTPLQEINHVIWKYTFGVYTSRKYVSSHYHILYYQKPGNERTFNLESRFGREEKSDNSGSLNYQDREDVWMIPREYKPGVKKNKNELPEALLIKMLQYSSKEDNLVVDFFLGGGSTGRVARGLNRKFVGFELSEKAFEHSLSSIKNISPGSLLPLLRKPHLVPKLRNEGATWTKQEYTQLKTMYLSLRKEGLTKKITKERLCVFFERGHWAIEKALRKLSLSD